MIAYLHGVVREKTPEQTILDVHGVGYRLLTPLSTFYQVPEPGAATEFLVHTHVREDQITLFGFFTRLEMELFRALTQVHGCGPKLALTALSGMAPEDLVSAIRQSQTHRLVSIPGIGKKTAERLVYELKDKLPKLISVTTSPSGPTRTEAITASTSDNLISALVNLGYPVNKAESAIRDACAALPDGTFEALLKHALQRMMR